MLAVIRLDSNCDEKTDPFWLVLVGTMCLRWRSIRRVKSVERRWKEKVFDAVLEIRHDYGSFGIKRGT